MAYEKVFLNGETIKSYVEFRDFDDNLRDPMAITFKIYDEDFQLIFSDAGSVVNESQGIYSCEYTLANEASYKRYILQWRGEIDGLVALNREKIQAVFIK